MKKKFSRILMLLAVAVTLGAFQSCKDANEDLYNQATLQAIADNASLQKALETQIANLQAQLEQYKQAMNLINSCQCDGSIPGTIASMQTTINNLQSQLNDKASAADITNLQNTINNYQQTIQEITNNNTTINNFITTSAVSRTEMEDAIKILEDQIKDASQKCNCDFSEILDRLSKVEQAAVDAKSKADAAMDKAVDAAAAAAAAQTAADNAATAAANAATAAANAATAAANAQTTADGAKAAADAAQKTADAAKEIADAAKSLAETNKTAIETNATNIKNIELRLVTMSDSLKTAYETAAAAQAATETNKKLIDSLAVVTKATEDALAGLTTTVTNLSTKVDNIESQVNTNKTNIENLQTSVTNLQGDVTTLYNKVDSLGGEIDDLKDEIIKLYAYSDANLEKAKAYTDLEIALLKSYVAESIKDAIDGVTGGSTLTIKDLKELIDQNASDISDLNDKYDDLKDQVDQNTIDLSNLTGTVNQHTTDITNIQTQIGNILGDITGIKTDITDLKDADSKLNQRIDSVVTQLDEYKTLTDGRLDILGDSIYKNYQDILLLQTRVTAIENSYVTNTVFTTTVKELTESINANAAEIAAVKTAYQKADSILQDEIDTLNAQVKDLESRVKKNEDDIAEITGKLDIINEYLAKQVTGIIIQGTKNPLFGSVSAPFNVQSNILLAYYGYPENKVEFPTNRTGNYVRAEEALTAADIQMLNGVSVFESSTSEPLMYENGYSGKIYVTINPNTADLDGLKLDIVNSQDVVSPIKLAGLQKSDEVLEFGFSRAANNGFYEADATVDPAQVLNIKHPSLDASKIKDALTEIVKNRTGANMSSIASDLYDAVKGFKIERSGLKCSYTENGNEHAVYSPYSLAATSFEPLSLVTLKDLNVKTVPGYEKANVLLDKVASKLKSEVHVIAKEITGSTLANKVSNLTIKDIEIQDLTAEQLALFKVDIDTTIYIGGLKYHLDLEHTQNVEVKFDKNLTIPVNVGTTVTVPVNINKDVEVDLTGVQGTYSAPTIVVSSDVSNKDASLGASLVVPIKDEYGNPAKDLAGNEMYAVVPLDQVEVKNDITTQGGTITLDGKVVANLKYKEDINVDVNINQDINYHLDITQTVPVTVNIEKWVYFGEYNYKRDAAGNIVYKADGVTPILEYVGEGNGEAKGIHLYVSRDLSDAAETLWGTVKDQLGGVNKMLGDVRDIVDEVNKLLDKVNGYEDRADNAIDKYIGKLQDYLEKINDKAVSLINSVNDRLQPVMVASTGSGLKRLSGSKNYPTVLNSSTVSFYPTSWTLETLVPLARKHVAVTNVFKGSASAQGGNADCKARLQAANNHPNMNLVFDGSIRGIGADGFVAGYVYEIAYSALDFHGKIATRKYYITIGK